MVKRFNEMVKGSPKEISREVSDAVNNMFFDRQEAVLDITGDPAADEIFMALSLAWVGAGAEDARQKWAYDGRNEYSVKVCEKLAQAPMFQDGTVKGYLADRRTARETVELMRDMHRTLKQTFSSLVFRYLRAKAATHLSIREAVEALDAELGAGWEACPLI